MAIVRKLERKDLDRNVPHKEVECTYWVVTDDKGGKYLQLLAARHLWIVRKKDA